ncbi:hypothetical protein A4X09_0g1880 [Tilletia walkeri]|uniref:Uncharacterized protein n=1 Tax=Tilletia walkeri TaxID=117179 RepID=A0A8X7NCE7_9BASI|nr:hypothetical protein A4X09_0g1880 [Tilletia walkeri]
MARSDDQWDNSDDNRRTIRCGKKGRPSLGAARRRSATSRWRHSYGASRKDGPGWCASSPYRAGVITIGSAGTHPGMRPTSLAPTRPISGRHVAFFEADKLEFGGDRIKKESKTAKRKGKGVATGATAEPVADDLGPRSATWKPGLTGKIRNTTAHGRALSRHFKTRTGVGLVDDDGLRTLTNQVEFGLTR